MTDPFFEIIHDGLWNACVGVEGSEMNYVEGYLDAAAIIADRLVAEEMMGKRDTLVMPILYNARHGLELAMKYVVAKLVELGLVHRPEGRANHHILRYWQHLRDAEVADRVVRELVDSLEPYVKSLSRIDVDGQQLRYFATGAGERSLGQQSVVHLLLVRDSVARLRQILGDLTDRVAIILDEYPTGTRTTRCSRPDLSEIVNMVGAHATWAHDDFLERRDRVMERFSLTKKAFSNALDAVRTSRELASRIGLEHQLVHVEDEKAIRLAERWLQTNPPANDDGRLVGSRGGVDLEGIALQAPSVKNLVAVAEGALTLEEFADIETIFYIGRNGEFGEYYEMMVAETVQAHRLDHARRSERIYHIMSKLNFVEGLVSGLGRVGRPSLGARIQGLRDATRTAAG